MFAGIMSVQGDTKIYIYDTSLWSRKSIKTDVEYDPPPLNRLWENGIVFSKLRFVNHDRWLTSYGEARPGARNPSGVRVWDTLSWSVVHIIHDGST